MRQVAIDNIAAAASPLLTSVGFSGLTGFLIGYAIKHVMKIVAVGAGILFAALMYLQQQGMVSVNWDKLEAVSRIAVSTLANAIGEFSHTSANFALPMTGTAALGFAIGILRYGGFQMFNILKKLKPQHQITELEQELPVRERAINVFSRIEGLDDIKEMMLRALESPERAHTLLTGSPASAKSLFMLEIEKFLRHKVYFAEGAATTKAGLQRFIAENQNKEIIIIDEIDKMAMKDQEGLLSMMELGEFTTTKVRNTKTVKANIVIFATSNSTERLSKPLLSRFTIFEIPPYSYEEFEGIALRLINKLHPNVVIQIASSVWKTGSRDIRDVLKIAKLCSPSDGEEDISRLISIHQKYHKTGKEYN